VALSGDARPVVPAALAGPVVDVLQPWGTSQFRAHSIVPILDHFHDRVVQVHHPWHRRWSGAPLTWAAAAERVGPERSELWSRPTATEFADPAAERFGTPFLRSRPRQPGGPRRAAGSRRHQPGQGPLPVLGGLGAGLGGCRLHRAPAPRLLPARRSAGGTTVRARWDRLLEAVQLCWPEDRAGALGGDTDLPFTYVAGPEPLLRAIDAGPRIETGSVAATTPVGPSPADGHRRRRARTGRPSGAARSRRCPSRMHPASRTAVIAACRSGRGELAHRGVGRSRGAWCDRDQGGHRDVHADRGRRRHAPLARSSASRIESNPNSNELSPPAGWSMWWRMCAARSGNSSDGKPSR
jgi:hypothetical protein